MASLIRQGEAKVVTKNGEVFVNIALELTLKLEGTGIQGAVSATGGATPPQAHDKDDEKVKWEIPDFSSNKIEFGK
jgi:hypothetical protein